MWEAGLCQFSVHSLSFKRVPGLPYIVSIADGAYHSAAIDTEGGLWVWTSKTDLSWALIPPQRVDGLSSLLKVACGDDFLVAEGLWVLGDNLFGQLGLGHTNSALQPTLIQVQHRSQGPLRCLVALNDGVILIDSEGSVINTRLIIGSSTLK